MTLKEGLKGAIVLLIVLLVAGTVFAGGRPETPTQPAAAPSAPLELPDLVSFRADILSELGINPATHEDFFQAVSRQSERVGVSVDRPIRIGFATPSFDISDAWERWYWSMVKRLEAAGIPHQVNMQAASRHDAHSEQRNQVEALIAAGVDYMVLGPTELLAQRTTIQMVHDAGIPLFILNFTRPLPGDNRTLMYIAFDHTYGGVMSGMHIAERLGGQGKIAGLRFVPGQLDDQRWGGMVSVIERTNIDIVFYTHADGDRSLAYEATMDIMTAHPDLDAIYAVSSAMALGAAAALETLGKAGQVGVWGFGGTGDELEAMRRGRMTGSVFRFQDDAGAAIAEGIKRHLEGRQNDVPQVFMGDFQMTDDSMSVDDLRAMAERAHRYSRTEMGLGL